MTPLRIDADAAALRRRLGPVPWFVLEELLLLSDTTSGVNTGVRALAAGLSLNKDTVARAIVRLRDEGLVVAQSQALHAGRFGAGRYQIGPLAGVHCLDAEDSGPTRPMPARTRPSHRRRETTQLSLIDQHSTTGTDQSQPTCPSPPKQDDAVAPGVRPGPAGRHSDGGGTSEKAAGRC